jgi:hypothetical protein
MKRWVCCLLGFASCWGWAQSRDALLDFSLVAPPTLDQHKIVQPVVQWQMRADAPEYCAQIKAMDGFAVWQEGCVYWVRSPSACTIVTTGRTTHSQVGRLFLLCLSAGESS